ncbi:MAG: preprotein translocase subunit SecY [Spirochaetaceae bacterium]|nr:preprotein translocase subunit SecY [Spirochaetaceae bacterium]
MANSLVNIFRIEDLRKKILFTLVAFVVFRFGAHLIIPGIDPQALSAYFKSTMGSNSFVDQMDFFVGGAFSNFSVFMLGVMPYISTEILFQLAMFIFPGLKKIAEEEGGRRKIQGWTRVATIAVALLQSSAIIAYASGIPGAVSIPRGWHIFITLLTVTTGTMITVWLGEQITTHGVGNGISMLIFAGIVARLPGATWELVKKVRSGDVNLVFVVLAFLMFIAIVILVIYEHQGQRKIMVDYAKRVVGRKVYGGQSTYIPFKINPAGVMPVIFASSILMFPTQLASMFAGQAKWVRSLSQFLNPMGLWYNIIYVVLIIVFAYFQTMIQLNPTEIARQLRENGGSVRGVRAEKTEEYLQKILNRLVFPGAIYLAIIAVIPTIIQLSFNFPREIATLMGGTSLLILVGVDIDTMAQIEAQLKMHHHEGLVKKGKLRGRGL